MISALLALLVGLVAFRVGSAVRPGATLVPSAPSADLNPFDGIGGGGSSAPPSPSGPSGSGGQSALTSAVAAKVAPGVVNITTRLGYQNAAAAGTGMVLSPSGEVLTNNHVVDGATAITATVVGNGRSYTAKVVGTDPSEDVAVIELQNASGLPTIPLGHSSTVSEGDPVVAMGNAGGRGGDPTVVTGTVQALGRTIVASDAGGANPERLTDLIQIDAPIEPGDSGGPLADTSARVIGMDTAASGGNRFRSTAGTGFAIPIDKALSVARQIEAGQAGASIHVGARGVLGVEVSSRGSDQAGAGDGPPGALVAGVEPGSPAASAGLSTGDTITAVGGRTVDSGDSLTLAMGGRHPGDKLNVTWTDQSGTSHTATVSLAAGPAD